MGGKNILFTLPSLSIFCMSRSYLTMHIFTGGLDVEHNLDGPTSLYTTFKEHEIMFHVSTLLTHVKNDPQQLPKKRHIGNGIRQTPSPLPWSINGLYTSKTWDFQNIFAIKIVLPNPSNYFPMTFLRSGNIGLHGGRSSSPGSQFHTHTIHPRFHHRPASVLYSIIYRFN